MASEDSAATTYVYAAERNALLAYWWFPEFVIPDICNHARARRLASISTGNVMKLKSVVDAKSIIPANSSCGMVCTVRIPIRSTHVMMLDENCTKGTSAERIFNGA